MTRAPTSDLTMLYRRRETEHLTARKRCIGASVAATHVAIGGIAVTIGATMSLPLAVIIGTLLILAGSIGLLGAILLR